MAKRGRPYIYRPSGVVLRKPAPPARISPIIHPQDAQLVRAGRVAWKRIRETADGTFESWVAIGRALKVGRRLALAAMSAKVGNGKKPLGGAYNKLIGPWLKENGLDDIDPASRSDAIWVVDQLPEVSEWRDVLPQYRRVGLNHPGYVKKEYFAAKQPEKAKPRSRKGIAGRRATPHMVEALGRALRPYLPFQPEEIIHSAAISALQAIGLSVPANLALDPLPLAHLPDNPFIPLLFTPSELRG
jgi:hypothetical protein